MYVVRRAFRNNGEMIVPGSAIEPGTVKRFKTRLRDREIVDVQPHNYEQWKAYFTGKFGVELPPICPPVEEPPICPPVEEPPVKVKVIVK